MADSSSSPSSENEAENHPYQQNLSPGPKGAYEARQAKGGLYIRVDMPGVPPDGVKLFKYSDTRTVTFSGKAPKRCVFDSSERVYGGYVVLDRDPTKVDVEMTLINGCLRLFFPSSEGTLHFFPSKNNSTAPNLEGFDHEQFLKDDVVLGSLTNCYRHPIDCSCCKGKDTAVSVLGTVKSLHINPFLMQGVEGVCEKKVVEDGAEERVYVRVDMPGLEPKKSVIWLTEDRHLTFGGNGRKQYHLDEGGRRYVCWLFLQCTCCKILGVVPQVKDGVFRISFTKFNLQKYTLSPTSE